MNIPFVHRLPALHVCNAGLPQSTRVPLAATPHTLKPRSWLCLLLGALVAASAAAAGDGNAPASDIQALKGQALSGANYPFGWTYMGGNFVGNPKAGIGISRVRKERTDVLVLEQVTILPGADVLPAVRILDAVPLRRQPNTKDWYEVTPGCTGEGTAVNSREGQIFVAEVLYRKCARYSTNVLSAWVLDMRKGTITAAPRNSVRCENTLLDSGEISGCKHLSKGEE